MAEFANVNIKVAGKTQQIKMEKGVVFENKGGKYTIDANGQLMKFDKNSNVWVNANQIDMTKYQWEAFQNVSDNDGQVGTYSKRDIQLAQAKYKNGEFTKDMKKDLPAGYRIENPKLKSSESSIEVKVTNGKEDQSATLKFQIAELNDLKSASDAYQSQISPKPTNGKFVQAKKVNANDMNILKEQGLIDENGKFCAKSEYSGELEELPFIVSFSGINHGIDSADGINEIARFHGQPVTPALIDEMVNVMITFNLLDHREGALGDLTALSEYLTPETVDRLFEYGENSNWGEMTISNADVKNAKAFYKRLTPEQQKVYYQRTLSVDATSTQSGSISSEALDGKRLADYIFVDKVQGDVYAILKNYVQEMNAPNGIRRTKTETKALIDALKNQNKITQAQVNELYKAAGITK